MIDRQPELASNRIVVQSAAATVPRFGKQMDPDKARDIIEGKKRPND